MPHRKRYSNKFYQGLATFWLALALLFSSFGCDDEDSSTSTPLLASSTEDLEIPSSFDFVTTKEISIALELQAPDGSALKTVKVGFYNDKEDNDGILIASGLTDENGKISLILNVPSYLDSISIRPNYIGLVHEAYVSIEQSSLSLTIGGPNESTFGSSEAFVFDAVKQAARVLAETWYTTLGTWNHQGVPNYLESPGDVITQDLLDDLNASLPESQPVPTANPEYLVDSDMNTKLKEDADLWITFVHEGAGWRNALGFYTYDIDNPPSSPDEIDVLYMIFPNVSYKNSGGGLQSGNKVKLGTFSAGIGIGWFLVPDGWNSSTREVTEKSQIKWSVKDFNAYVASDYRQHMIALKDENRELILLGFEDTSRPAGDNDFNDCIFYVSANPFTAIQTDELISVKTEKDADEDGVDDYSDEYPNDPDRAYNQYAPAKNVYGTVAFEDLWPAKGDYDFNDIVVDYNHQLVMNASNQVVEMSSSFKTRAIGGTYKNGFGYELQVDPSKIEQVSGYELTENIISTNANGTEAEQTNAVIIVYDNAYAHMTPSSGYYTVNAEKGSPYQTPYTSDIFVTFTEPLAASELGSSPYNPFIISNKRRGYEIHLPGSTPTDLCADSLFSTQDDDTNPANDYYFKTQKGHPWAVHIPEAFDYPSEKSDIVKAYLYFANWAESGGNAYPDWYQDKTGYRDDDYIY
ncbi:hypothetical protein Ctha_0375 [Chloroherpeton thalassium ATCC 35110]|uniref:DUF4842 domain-containing protein n=1 Tax=Chloroherpeton thalassium (strain ATCC 35110 / GB-78) TaxID=517418 RepID=B3QU48_CHLT3|nr:LruC domain-containing protein [Chloroherpeton thalassium]ACF12846.1 hypothetical protein Ctha_0375 [Chloroherpeton thalassium ATCC 35110]